MSSNLTLKGTRWILAAALLSEAIKFCEKKSGSKSSIDSELINQEFKEIYL